MSELITKEDTAENGGTYYTIVNTTRKIGDRSAHVHTTKKSTMNRIRRCYKQLKKYGMTTEKSLSVRNSAMKLLGFNFKK